MRRIGVALLIPTAGVTVYAVVVSNLWAAAVALLLMSVSVALMAEK